MLVYFHAHMNKILRLIKHPISYSKKVIPYIRTKIYYAQIRKDERNQQDEADRLMASYKRYSPLLLHIGCGPRILPKWVNIDLSRAHTKLSSPEDFYALNLLQTGLPLPDNCCDGIFHEDFIEHIDQKEQVIFLAETLRVMKPGAIHRVNTPNLLNTVGRKSDFKNGKAGVFTPEWDKWVHKSILTPAYLKELALMVGYRDVVFNSKNKSGSRYIPTELRPGTDREDTDSNLFADLIK